jgi:hypothetical protein
LKVILRTLSTLVGNLLTVLLGLAVALLLAEYFVRLYLPSPDYGTGKRPALRNKLFMHDELLGWKGSPNATSPYISKDFIVTVTHDALGYRNISPPYVPGKKNYLLLGDSYGWGWGVNDNETAAEVLNRKQGKYHFYNLSIPGYGTDQEYLAMTRFLSEHPDYKYDGVVLLFYYNDFENVGAAEMYMYAKPAFTIDNTGKLQLQNIPVPKNDVPPISITEEPPPRSWIQKSQLANFALDSLGRLISVIIANKKPEVAGTISFNQWEKDTQVLANALLQEIHRVCTEKNMDFHVVFLMTINTDEKPTAMINALVNQLQGSSIEYSFFHSRAFPRTDLWLDTHYTPYGQTLLANHIADVIAEKEKSSGQ